MDSSSSFPLFYDAFNMSLELLIETEKKMRPHQISQAGFLSEDDRLIDISFKDLRVLKIVNLSFEQIADSLRGIIFEAKLSNCLSKQIIGNKFEIEGLQIPTNGYQECPFPLGKEKCSVGRQDFKVTNLWTGENFIFSDLGIHLIEDHHFFEGNSAYRMDPEKIIRVLDLNANNYKRIVNRQWKWVEGVVIDEEPDLIKILPKYAKKMIEVDEFAVAFIGVPFSNYDKFIYDGKTEIEKRVIEYKIKDPETRHSDEEIERIIRIKNSESFFKVNLDKKIVNSPEKEHLYVINKKERLTNLRTFEQFIKPSWKIKIEGVLIDENLSHPGIYIFKEIKFSYSRLI